MIKITLYGETKEINEKPSSFEELCQIISKLHKLEDPHKFTFEYLCSDNKYYPLNLYSYPEFFVNGNVQEIFIYSSPTESNCQLNENNNETNQINSINEKEENETKLKEEEIDFYENNEVSDDDKNTNDNIENIEEKKDNINELSKPEISKEQVMSSIIRKQKEKIHNERKKKKEEEMQKAKEKDLKEKKKKEKKEKKLEKAKEKKEKEKMSENAKEKQLNKQIKNILSAQLEKFKKDLITSSNVQLSQIITNSKINQEIENNQIPDSIENHKAIACSSCGTFPIVGNRYKCVYCDDVDFCEDCEKENAEIHNHPLYKLRFVIN